TSGGYIIDTRHEVESEIPIDASGYFFSWVLLYSSFCVYFKSFISDTDPGMSRKRPAKMQKKEEQDEDVECSQAKQFMTEKPSKEPKKEEPDEEDIKDFHEGTATGSVSYHIKGQILPEQLMHRNLHNCEYCEFSAQTDDRLVAHREQKHKIYLCRFCKSEFASKFTQYKHYTAQPERQKKSAFIIIRPLQTCADLLAMRSKVKKQCAEIKDRSHTQDCIRCMHIKVKCPLCNIVFANMFDLGDHRQHPCKQYSAKLFACNGCKVQFTTANGLKSHLIAKYNERDFKCYNTGMLCYENMKIPKYTRSRAQASDEKSLEGMQNSVTLSLVPIKDEPTLPDEMPLVASHLLSEYDGTIAGEYYNAMRKMFYHVACPFCGVECRTHSALHTHALIHHPPHERCLYQCRGCSLTFQTPTGLAQHLKREFDESNPVCYNTVSLVRKEDYLGPLTGWNRKTWNMRKKMPRCHQEDFRTVDVKTGVDEEDDRVKKEEADDGYEDPAGTRLRFPMNQSSMKGDREVKMEPEDEIKQETRD
ncbi:hypothetical protein PRIPAC_80128, partial [Pristionchus pacificus]|uniref:C2H2-type domain-containing protein n=1 Tax=Pristionchus pacificus TaxID=54126 RepID=A0A2A6BXB6_PRIPA